MPPKEFELLYYLASNKNKVFTREQLCVKFGDMIIQEIQEL